MRMFEKLHVGTYNKYATDDELERAQKVYERYVGYEHEKGHDQPRSFIKFLLEDVDYYQLDSFLWDKGELVKTYNGKIGVTTGWEVAGCSQPHFEVLVKTAKGTKGYLPEGLSKADVPPEVLEYAKSTLQGKVHDKVDEAFNNNQGE